MPMGRELLDRNVEPLRWQIAHSFAQWATQSAVRSQGRGTTFPKSQENVNAYLNDVDLDRLFDRSLGLIESIEFNDWHTEQIAKLQACHPNISVGWAAKMIAVYLKTTCYLAGFGRDGLDSVIHPPFDNILMMQIGEHLDSNNIVVSCRDGSQISDFKWVSNIRIKDTDDATYRCLVALCKIVASNLDCTLFEVEQLWTTK